MKKSIKIYPIGSTVYAADAYHVDGKESNYIAIREAVVNSINISYDKDGNSDVIEYWLDSPDGQEWGDCVRSELVAGSYEELVGRLKKRWIEDSNKWN